MTKVSGGLGEEIEHLSRAVRRARDSGAVGTFRAVRWHVHSGGDPAALLDAVCAQVLGWMDGEATDQVAPIAGPTFALCYLSWTDGATAMLSASCGPTGTAGGLLVLGVRGILSFDHGRGPDTGTAGRAHQ